jgi:hypothetical protein
VFWAWSAGRLDALDSSLQLLFATGALVMIAISGATIVTHEGLSALDLVASRWKRWELVAAAEALGLEPVGPDASGADQDFPFLRPVPRSPMVTLAGKFVAILALTVWLLFVVVVVGLPSLFADEGSRALVLTGGTVVAGAIVFVFGGISSWLFRPRRPKDPQDEVTRRFARPGVLRRVERVLAGRWNDLDARVFDYSFWSGDVSQLWTCAVLPVETGSPQLEIARRDWLAQMIPLALRRSVDLGDTELERLFRIQAFPETDAPRMINSRVRLHLLEEAPPDRLVIQVRNGHLLYCGPRMPLQDRGTLLGLAGRLRDALPRLGA